MLTCMSKLPLVITSLFRHGQLPAVTMLRRSSWSPGQTDGANNRGMSNI